MTPDPNTPSKRPPIALIAIIGAVVAVVWGGIWLWEERIEDHVVVRRFGVVTPGHVYRSGRLTESTLRKVHRETGIRTVIDFGGYVEGSDADAREQQVCEQLGVRRHVFRLNGDATGNPNAYVAALRLLADERNHPVLIHCSAGSERTGAAAILYRSILEGRSIADVYPESFKYDHDPDDWILLAYLADHAGEIEAAFRSGGWIPGHAPMTLEDPSSAAASGPNDEPAGGSAVVETAP